MSRSAGLTRSFPAIFARGGTSNGLIIQRQHLPPEAEWHTVLPAAMGSPDPYGRQLDGLGSGISSTSKVMVLGPPSRPDVDVDYTFVQVGIKDGHLDMAGNCGNMSAVVGPASLDWGLVENARVETERASPGGDDDARGDTRSHSYASIRMLNTNTDKVVVSRFRVTRRETGSYTYCHDGAYAMDGVPGTGSRITLSFLDPAGAKTGLALPTGNPVDHLQLSDGTAVAASLVDVGNPGVFVHLADVMGPRWAGSAVPADYLSLSPGDVEANATLKLRLDEIRRAGAARMGLDPRVESVPKVVVLFPRTSGGAERAGAGATEGLRAGEETPAVAAERRGTSAAGIAAGIAVGTTPGTAPGPGGPPEVHIRCLAMSMGQAHKAVPLTLALCLGAAARMPGTTAAALLPAGGTHDVTIIGHPSGQVDIGTTFAGDRIVSAELHRTARYLMEGNVFY